MAPLLTLLAGCASHLDQALLADRNPAGHRAHAESEYCVHCPDVLRVTVPGWDGDLTIEPDGEIRGGKVGPVRVEGETAVEISREVAEHLGVAPAAVRVRVSSYKSQRIYLHGEVAGLQRAVPYEGPETVVELLQRVGGIATGAEPGDIQIVRPRIADGGPPEIFHINLDAILKHGDQSTNIRLEPFDQVYIGQSRRHCLACCLPPWLRHLFGGGDAALTGPANSVNFP